MCERRRERKNVSVREGESGKRLFIVWRYEEDAFYAFPKMPAERKKGGGSAERGDDSTWTSKAFFQRLCSLKSSQLMSSNEWEGIARRLSLRVSPWVRFLVFFSES